MSSYTHAFDDAMAELKALLERRAQIDERLAGLRDAVRALSHCVSDDKKRRETLMKVLDDISLFAPRLTTAVKDALYSALGSHHHRRLSATDVKLLMEVRKYDFSNFPNPLASIHSTLRRLANQGEIGSTTEKGTTVYFWNGPIFHDRAKMRAIDEQQRALMDRKISERVSQRLEDFSRRRLTIPR